MASRAGWRPWACRNPDIRLYWACGECVDEQTRPVGCSPIDGRVGSASVERGQHLGRYPTAVTDLHALALGPRPNIVQIRALAAGAG